MPNLHPRQKIAKMTCFNKPNQLRSGLALGPLEVPGTLVLYFAFMWKTQCQCQFIKALIQVTQCHLYKCHCPLEQEQAMGTHPNNIPDCKCSALFFNIFDIPNCLLICNGCLMSSFREIALMVGAGTINLSHSFYSPD